MWWVMVCAMAAPDVAEAQQRLERSGMGVLAGWSVANLGAGAAGAWEADSPEAQAFWATSGAWNVVNLGIAGAGLATVGGLDRLDGSGLAARQRRLRTTLLVNAGLDVAYVGAGAGLWASGVQQADPAWVGAGQAVATQGLFLLGFDLIMAAAQHRQIRRGRGSRRGAR